MKSIIVIDMQKGFINKNNTHIVDKINNYLKTNAFDFIFYTAFINSLNSPFVKILNYKNMIDRDEQNFVVDIVPNSTIFEKEGYGLTQEMITVLKDNNIQEIELCGTDTDACVMAIAYNLFDNNIRPIIKSELCATSSFNNSIHTNSLEIMKRSFGKNNVN